MAMVSIVRELGQWSNTATVSCSMRHRLRQSTLTIIANASTSTSINFKTRLSGGLSPSDRVRRGVEALSYQQQRHMRVSATMLDAIMSLIRHADFIRWEDAEFLFRCCGHLTPAESAEKRLQYAQMLWDQLPRLGLHHGVWAYGLLQRVYLQSGQIFSSDEFLNRVRNAGYTPDAKLYFGAILRCSKDDQPEMEKINSYITAIKRFPMDWNTRRTLHEILFRAYARARKQDQLKAQLAEAEADAIANGDVSFTNSYYFSVAVSNAKRGNTSAVLDTVNAAREKEAALTDFQVLYLTRVLVHVGRQDSILRILSHLLKDRWWIHHTLTCVLALIAEGHVVSAMTVLQRSTQSGAACVADPYGMSVTGQASTDRSDEWLPWEDNIYNFIMDLCYLKLPATQILAICGRLSDCGYRNDVFQLATVAAFDMKRQDVMDLLRGRTDSNFNSTWFKPICNIQDGNSQNTLPKLEPQHFSEALHFRSLFGRVDSVLALLKRMSTECKCRPRWPTLADDVLEYFYSPVFDTGTLLAVFGKVASLNSLFTAAVIVCLRRGDGGKAREFLLKNQSATLIGRWRLAEALAEYYKRTRDVQLVREILNRLTMRCNRECGLSADARECARRIYDILRHKIDPDDLEPFSVAFPNSVRNHLPLMKSL